MKKLVKLKANLFNGEGDVIFSDDWHNLDNLMKADILQDWIGELTKEYNFAVTHLFHTTEKL